MELKHLQGLVFDCQATSADPEKGFLLEMAWAEVKADYREDIINRGITSYLIRADEQVALPRQVVRITGITYEALCTGASKRTAWLKLASAAETLITSRPASVCPLIVHYARFEQAYLNALHQRFAGEKPFPFEIVCTHQIAKGLWPELPRKGLRAIAGFLGYSVGEKRRSADHVAATRWIWQQMVIILEKREGVKTLEELRHWLSHRPPKGKEKKYPMEKAKRSDLPDQPGIYRMLRSNGDVLYIGKATSLKQRVNSYFQRRGAHADHILEMLSQAVALSFSPARSALEAALMESDEIKQASPPYNIALRQRDRQVCFSDRQMNRFSNRYSKFFSLGPLPSSDLPQALSLILKMSHSCRKGKQIKDDLISQTLAVPLDLSPSFDCFNEGFGLFFDEHKALSDRTSDINTLITIGTVLWERQLAEKAMAELSEPKDDSREETDEETGEIPWEWTPERVARRLSGLVCHGAYLLRRAAWFSRLSESTLLWTKRKAGQEGRQVILISKASIVTSLDLLEGAPVPIPPGVNLPAGKRLKGFTIADYDRLRILTTEIRRLIREGRDPVLYFGPDDSLKGDDLKMLFMWV